jgi:hypothetical protein
MDATVDQANWLRRTMPPWAEALTGVVVVATAWFLLRFVADYMGPDSETFQPLPRLAIWLVVGFLSTVVLSRSRWAAVTAAGLGIFGFFVGMALASTFLGIGSPVGEDAPTAFAFEVRRAIALAYVEPATIVLTGVFAALALTRRST